MCDENVPRMCFVGHLRSVRHTSRCRGVVLGEGVVALHSAFASRIASYRVSTANYHISVVEFMVELKPKIIELLEQNVLKHTSVKFNFELFGYFVLEAQDLHDVKSFITANDVATRGTNLSELYDNLIGILDAKVSEFQERESGKLSFFLAMLH